MSNEDRIQCPHCQSTHLRELGGEAHNNIFCIDCGKLFIVTWQNYRELYLNLLKCTPDRSAHG